MTAASAVSLTVPRLGRFPASRRALLRHPTTGQAPRLSVVIVNYHQWEETAALTRQVLASPAARDARIEVVIVDNHSPGHPLTGRLRRCRGVSLRRWKRNRGFARAVNEGCRLSQGRWVLILNPDVTLSDDFLQGILTLIDSRRIDESNAGVVGFHLRNTDGSYQYSSGLFPTLGGTLGRLMLPRARRKYSAPSLQQPGPVPWVTGCCLLLQRDCLEAVGGFDEDFFLYYEDVDFCRRARARGWSVWYEPALQAVHHRPLHSRQVSPRLRVVTRHALLTYSAKHWPRWQFLVAAGLVRIEAQVKALWADAFNDRATATYFRALAGIARDLARGAPQAARQRLDRVVRREERRRAS